MNHAGYTSKFFGGELNARIRCSYKEMVMIALLHVVMASPSTGNQISQAV